MAFLEQLVEGASFTHKRFSIGIALKPVTKSWAEPVTTAQLKDHMKIRHSVEDVEVGNALVAARVVIERTLGLGLMEQEWKETLNTIPVPYELSLRDVLSISSIKYITGWDSDTQLLVDSSAYVLANNSIVPRATWPSHRGWQSFEIIYKIGFAAKGAADDAALTAARAAIDEDLILAVKHLAAWFFENREGQGYDAQFKAAAERGVLPQMVTQLIGPYIKWGL
jgi:uncharacterized phiE125 gp8 family phage protein